MRRYGFHGLSHAWAARRAGEIVPGSRRVVTCHLGAGASLTAVLDGRSVDTTMGFTPIDGLVMAPRSGALNPGLILWIGEQEGLTPREVADTLEHRSGLLGLTGTTDMRELMGRTDHTATRPGRLHPPARGKPRRLTAALGGLNTVVFTGGVDEHDAEIRRRPRECGTSVP